jgi:hypothetical protein
MNECLSDRLDAAVLSLREAGVHTQLPSNGETMELPGTQTRELRLRTLSNGKTQPSGAVMDKKIIAGAAILFLSAGVALAQTPSSSTGNNSPATSRSDISERGSTASSKQMRSAGHYPRAEARLNQAEVEETRELNREVSQQVASANRGGTNASAGQDQNTASSQTQQGQP